MKALFIQFSLLTLFSLIFLPQANCQLNEPENTPDKPTAIEQNEKPNSNSEDKSNPKDNFETSDPQNETNTSKTDNEDEPSANLESSDGLNSQIQDLTDRDPTKQTESNNNKKSPQSTNPRKKSDIESVHEVISAPKRLRPIKYRIKAKSFDEMVDEAENWVFTVGIQSALIFILTIVAMFFSNVISKKLFEFAVKDRVGTELKKRATTLSTISRYLMVIGIMAIGGMMILKELGVDIAPLIAGAGVLGIALGFGAQSVVKDLISGAFILLEDQIRVGDVIRIADKSGIVEKVTLRMVVLRDVSGNVHFIPSGDIQIVTNMTKVFSRYLFDIGVAYKENTDEVIKLIKAVDEEMREDEVYKDYIIAPLEVMGVQRFESSSVIIRARTKTHPGKQWRVGREFNRRIKMSFDKNGIEIPFPHMTVYQGIDKEGESSPINLHFKNDPTNLKSIVKNFDSE